MFDKRGDLKSLCNKKDYFVIIQTLTELKLAGIKSYLYKVKGIANFSQKLPIYVLYCTLLEYKAKLIYLGGKIYTVQMKIAMLVCGLNNYCYFCKMLLSQRWHNSCHFPLLK